MRRRLVWLSLGVLVAALAIASVVVLRTTTRLPATQAAASACASAGIEIAPESLTAIYEHPESILADPAAFWATDPAYQLISQSPWIRGRTVPPDGWVGNIERVAARSARGGRSLRDYTRAAEIAGHTDAFCTHALPVIASLLPEGASLSTTVHLTALTDHSCFAYRGNVVMDTSAHTPAMFYDVLGHELFHIGYFSIQPYQTEVWVDDYPTKIFLTTLQNDGLAVYVQQLLSDAYPVPLELELLLLNNKLAVRYLTGRVNALLGETYELSEVEIIGKAFRGVNQRALYTVGAHMARTIDEALGREALARTVAEGPRSFVATYNAVAKPSLRILEMPEPKELSQMQALRDAALREDYDCVTTTVAAIGASGADEPDGALFEHLSSAGLVLLRDGHADLAVDVFELITLRFPDHPDGYLHLAEAYRQVGKPDQAEAAHCRALELDPAIVAIADR